MNSLIEGLLHQGAKLGVRPRERDEFIIIDNGFLALPLLRFLGDAQRLCETRVAFRDCAFVRALWLLRCLASGRIRRTSSAERWLLDATARTLERHRRLAWVVL